MFLQKKMQSVFAQNQILDTAGDDLAARDACSTSKTPDRYLGIDVGSETVKLVELRRRNGALLCTRREIVEHAKTPDVCVCRLLATVDWSTVRGAAVSGRFSRRLNLPRIPTKVAQARAYRFLHDDDPVTIVSIGSHGFSVLELRRGGVDVFRENSRCSQGTGSFLRQLVERFDLDIAQASRLVEDVREPSPLSGRCPVILKTDMTHLANKGECHAGILAGLYDAVCENVQVLVKPQRSPPRVLLIGGVTRSRRVHDHFRCFLNRHGMELLSDGDAVFYEALGCALAAAEQPAPLPPLEELWLPKPPTELEVLPALSESLGRVCRMPTAPPPAVDAGERRLVLGLDIGSTGSKAVALDAERLEPVWEAYGQTGGDPVGASQSLVRRFLDGPAGGLPVLAVGVTGSGREIVASLLRPSLGEGAAFVLNEIAAHAAGACHYDPRVDTIFEIGGQDAKYIRLEDGHIVDAAMNEACSAGTGSFIEEQGKRFAGIRDVVQLGETALGAACGVSLGQHCSVFMAEIIDEAVAGGVDQSAIVAGLYDSIIQNFLNRVRGNRTAGRVIFCQGMPFSSPALAAAVARRTGSEVIVPPSPGMVGALGIALLADRHLVLAGREPLRLDRYLATRLERKESFVCKSTQGCGGAGNKCRIDRIRTSSDGLRQAFTWGGACSRYDRGFGRRKLPDRSPDPFREREELVQNIIGRVTPRRGHPRIAMTDEFVLKELFPFFATFFHELGYDPAVHTGADRSTLKRGIEAANVSFCAPMQQYRGLAHAMIADGPEILFLPMLRTMPRAGDESHSVCCPISQGSVDLLRWDLRTNGDLRVLAPLIDIGRGNLRSEAFVESCRRTAAELGVGGRPWRRAFQAAVDAQEDFDSRCLDSGRRALAFCCQTGVVPVVVLGRIYTLYNTVLNANVPAILREQGVLPVPVDCYPIEQHTPIFHDIYWGYGQRNLRAAHQIRRSPGLYSLLCSNYACGPDSFMTHFYGYLMEGKPFAVIETDGHAGDVGTKTRVEAFLHCVREDLARPHASQPQSLLRVGGQKALPQDLTEREELLLVPPMSEASLAVAASFRALGIHAESLPVPDQEALRMGRRYTSGKECLPMTVTLGSFLQRIERDPDPQRRFSLFMPTAHGPCRFGVYNLFEKVIVERLGLQDRVRIWSPEDRGYFKHTGRGFAAVAATGMMTADMLSSALHHVRPVERAPGKAKKIHERYLAEMVRAVESVNAKTIGISRVLVEAYGGHLFGCGPILQRAAAEFAEINEQRDIPTVLMVGEIYVRCDPFANDFLIDKLEERGLRVRLVPMTEWLEYTSHLNLNRNGRTLASQLSHRIQCRIQETCYEIMARALHWPRRTSVPQTLKAASPYIRSDLWGEAILTLGASIHGWLAGEIDGAVSVAPLECLPGGLAESQFFHVAEREGLKVLCLPVNGDPIDAEILDSFAYEVHETFRRRRESR